MGCCFSDDSSPELEIPSITSQSVNALCSSEPVTLPTPSRVFEPHCCICLSSKATNEILICGHQYHTACINQWFAKSVKKTCLLCYHSQN